ncbi:MAG: DNA repair protein [Ramlibacter sp.]|nr:DNA repair protein [Ramlibacter sp.]
MIRATTSDDQTILAALQILNSRLQSAVVLPHSCAVKQYLRLQAQGLTHEVFAVMYLDSQHRLIGYERLFRGTLTHTTVYPREVARQALAMNARSVVLHHNHPGGLCTPSCDDEAVTRRLQAALALVDVRVVDHVITSDQYAYSMAEHGLL